MPRPKKHRRICTMPKHNRCLASGANNEDTILLNVDEYETVRLLDYEHLTQEQCALQMGVGRTTVTLIYNNARSKIAEALVDGKQIIIGGGDYFLCEHSKNCCGQCGKGKGPRCHNEKCGNNSCIENGCP